MANTPNQTKSSFDDQELNPTRLFENTRNSYFSTVYPTIDVNCSILTREWKNKKLVDNIFSSNFVLLSMC